MRTHFWAEYRRRGEFTVEPPGGALFRGAAAIGAAPTKATAILDQVERVAGGDGGVDVAEGGGEAQHLQLRRPQRHQDGHRVVCAMGTNDPPAGYNQSRC